jgi:hypothetical protein
MCSAQMYSLAEISQPHPPAFGLIYEGAIGQPGQTTSLCNPLVLREEGRVEHRSGAHNGAKTLLAC